jgi:hypothetical protein
MTWKTVDSHHASHFGMLPVMAFLIHIHSLSSRTMDAASWDCDCIETEFLSLLPWSMFWTMTTYPHFAAAGAQPMIYDVCSLYRIP